MTARPQWSNGAVAAPRTPGREDGLDVAGAAWTSASCNRIDCPLQAALSTTGTADMGAKRTQMGMDVAANARPIMPPAESNSEPL